MTHITIGIYTTGAHQPNVQNNELLIEQEMITKYCINIAVCSSFSMIHIGQL